MQMYKITSVSLLSIIGIESFQWLDHLPIIIKFSGQSIIGVLTILFLIKKIQVLNDLRKNKDDEKNISIS